jgi:hypothetical protein
MFEYAPELETVPAFLCPESRFASTQAMLPVWENPPEILKNLL